MTDEEQGIESAVTGLRSAALGGESEAIKVQACLSLAYYVPNSKAVAVLNQVLRAERNHNVRLAALKALGGAEQSPAESR